jgi:hypothetical protein
MRISTYWLTGLLILSACKKENHPSTGGAPIRPVTASSKAYVTSFFEYNPAPGQFINTSIANDSAARSILAGSPGLLTLGAFGGYVTYGFDHTVLDKTGPDLFVVGNATGISAEPGVVWVSADLNGNGQPDDPWFELAGSAASQPGYLRNYAVTYARPNPANGNVSWTDNQGHSGFVLTNPYHTQDYYPDNLAPDSYTLTGTLLPSANIDTSNAAIFTSLPFSYGYCDNHPGGDSVDIASAIDSAGKPVSLIGIDFIRIQTGILFNMGWIGEQSTEVTAIADLSLYKN